MQWYTGKDAFCTYAVFMCLLGYSRSWDILIWLFILINGFCAFICPLRALLKLLGMQCSLLHYLVRPLEIGSARRTFGKEEEEEAKGDFLFVTSSIHSPPSLLRLRNINLGRQGKGGGKVGRKGHAQRIALPLVPYLPGDVVGLFIRHSEDITSLGRTSVSSSKFPQPSQDSFIHYYTYRAEKKSLYVVW